MDKYIFEGIYKNFEDCLVDTLGVEAEIWTKNSIKRFEAITECQQLNKELPFQEINRAGHLPGLLCLLSKRDSSKKTSVLDFGGGLGFTYLVCKIINLQIKNFEYHIVESKNNTKIGKELFQGDSNIHFYDEIPISLKSVDVVHLGSSLQYLDDWKTVIRRLASLNPSYFSFVDLIAGNIPAYVTLQSYYGTKLPYRFFNIDEIVHEFDYLGFELQMKSPFTGTFLGKLSAIPQDNFPEEYRLTNSCNLLLANKRMK